MRKTIFGHLALIGVTSSQPTAHDSLRDVTYTGSLSKSGTVEYFQGVRYAQDTSDMYRFAAARPIPEPIAGTLIDATKRGAACPQPLTDVPPFFSNPIHTSEDCLSLHIARPANANITSESRLPVLAWIFGGGGMYGSGSDPHTNPEKLIDLSVELKSPVVFVGINYRVGIFGFAASDELREQKSMNNGMRDQRAALEWIQANIAAFGGDPDRVTAYGLSAGGTYISLHQLAYGGEKGVPFNQAFVMSGPVGTALNQTSDQVKVNTAAVAEQLGCAIAGQEMLDCMRAIPMEKMMEVSYAYAQELHPPLGLFTFIAGSDGDILLEQPSKLLHSGRFVTKIPSILAWVEDDGAMVTGPASLVQQEDDIWNALSPWNGHLLSAQQKAELLEAYPASEFEESANTYNANKSPESPSLTPHYYRVAAFLRDLLFTCSSIEMPYYMQKRASTEDETFDDFWLYQLNQSVLTPMLASIGMDYVGASHGSDTSYIFNGVFPEGTVDEADLDLAKRLTASVIAFANTGNPNTPLGFDSWPKAYEGVADLSDQTEDMPSGVNILVVGGPHGTTSVRINKADEIAVGKEEKDDSEPVLYDRLAEGLGNAAQAVMDAAGSGAMKSRKAALAQQAVEKQKLFRRCAFVVSIAEVMGA